MVGGDVVGQTLLSTDYSTNGVSPNKWYTVATNCKLDTAAGSGVTAGNGTAYNSTISPKSQTFGTRSGAIGLNGDGTGVTSSSNNTAGRYFEFKLSPISSAYSLTVTSISLSAFVTSGTVYGAVLYSTDGTNWTSVDGKSITSVPATGAGSLLPTPTSNVVTPVTLSISLSSSLTILSNQFLIVRFIPMRVNAGTNSGVPGISNVTIGGTVNSLGITASPTSLTGFNYNFGSGPSASQNFTVAGTSGNLTSSIFVTAATNYEISTSSSFATTTSPIELPQTSGNVASTIIYTRLKAGLYGGTYNENIGLSSTTASGTISQNISCSGTVTGPVITVTPSTLNFFTTLVNTASANQTLTVSGSNLTAPIVITAPTDFEISTDPAGLAPAFSSSVVLTGATIPSTAIYVRLKSISTPNTFIENLTLTSTNALTRTYKCVGFVRASLPPTLAVSPSAITALDYNWSLGPSAIKNFSFIGQYLTDTSLIITTAAKNFEFALYDDNTASYGTFRDTLVFTPDASGTVPNTIVGVRLKAGLGNSSTSSLYSNLVAFSSYGCSSPSLTCSGTVYPTAYINEPQLATKFINYSGTSNASALQRIPIKATSLTSNLTLTLGASSKFEFYTFLSSGYTSSSKTLSPTSGTVSDTIYVRLKPGYAAGSYSDNITLASTGATSRTISLAGVVVDETVYIETFNGSTLGSAGTSYYSTNFTTSGISGNWTRSNVGQSALNNIWNESNLASCPKFKTATTTFIQTPKIAGVNALYLNAAEGTTGVAGSVTTTDGGTLTNSFTYTANLIAPSYYSSGAINPSATTTDIYKFAFASNVSSTHYLDNIVFTFKKPVTQDSAITVGHSASADTIKWKRPVKINGNKNQGCLVFVGKGAFTNPTSGVSYIANTTYGTPGSQLGTYYCVYNDTSQSVVVTGLNPDSLYNIYVLEYNGIKGQSDENYNVTNIAFNTTRPTATISGVAQNIKCGDNASVSITLTGTGPWSGTLSDGTSFSGATSPIVVALNPTTTTSYTVGSITDNNFSNVTSNLTGTPVSVNITTAVWKGTVSNVWENPANWCGGSVPSSTTVISVPNVPNLPIISTNVNSVKDITIETGANLTINDGAKLTVTGNLILNGAIANNGTLSFAGTGNQTFSSSTGVVSFMDSVEVNKIKVVGDTMIFNKSFTISGAFIPTSGFIKINNDTLTLASTNTGTASVGNATGASFIYSTNGKFTVERYIPTGVNHSKTWQLLSVPTFGQTIKDAWMEGAASSNDNPKSGYGTQTVGLGGWTNGFDLSSALPSVKTYNPANDTWTGVSSTNNTIANANGYMIFVRGDRSVTTYQIASNSTVLRTTGKIYSPSNPPATVVVPAGKFQTIGNPYASAIDFINLSNSNPGIDKYFYVWDPLFSGTYGGYRLFSLVNGWDDGESTLNYNSANTLIQSGQAVFVHNSGGTDVTLSFNENNKVSSSRMTFRHPTSTLTGIRTLIKNVANKLVDGTLVAINSDYSNGYESNDAIKLFNTNENISIVNNNKNLAIDARAKINAADTVFYQLNNLNNQQYQFVFSPENMMPLTAGMQAYLVDKYTNTRSSISLIDSTFINFDLNADASSHDPSRFYLVFKTSRVLPVRFLDVFASKNENKSVSIRWNVDNESNIKSYQVERSIDGVRFEAIGSVNQLLNNGNASTYLYMDADNINADKLFYRIRSVEFSGSYDLSKIVQLSAIQISSGLQVSPNPVTGDYLNVYFNNQQLGNYHMTIFNSQGQVIIKKEVSIKSKSEKHQILFGKKYASGKYLLKVCNHEGIITNINFMNP